MFPVTDNWLKHNFYYLWRGGMDIVTYNKYYSLLNIK